MNFKTQLKAGIGTLALLSCIQLSALAAGEDLFPAKLGNTWTLKGTAGTVPLNMDATITSSKTVGNKTTVVVHWTQNGSSQEESYSITPTEVARETTGLAGSSVITPPLPIIKYPMTPGKTWNWKGSLKSPTQTVNATALLKTGPRETVKTPAGEFKACKVDLYLTITQGSKSTQVKNSYWFAPRVGMVKQEITIPLPQNKTLVVQASATKYKVK